MNRINILIHLCRSIISNESDYEIPVMHAALTSAPDSSREKNPAPTISDRRQACHENHPTRSFLLSGNFLQHQMLLRIWYCLHQSPQHNPAPYPSIECEMLFQKHNWDMPPPGKQGLSLVMHSRPQQRNSPLCLVIEHVSQRMHLHQRPSRITRCSWIK